MKECGEKETSMTDRSLEEFTAALASKNSVPGGGGAAALAGALAASLGAMTGIFTIGKKKYKEQETRLIAMGEREEVLRKQLLAAVDDDASAFAPLAKAYSIPKDAPGRDETLEKCLRGAAEPPFTILRLSAETAELAAEYAEIGSKMMISDAGCAAAMAEAAMKAGYMNVQANTRLMKDRTFAEQMNADAAEFLKRGTAAAERTVKKVMDSLA